MGLAERYLVWYLPLHRAPEPSAGERTSGAVPPPMSPLLLLLAVSAAGWLSLKPLWSTPEAEPPAP